MLSKVTPLQPRYFVVSSALKPKAFSLTHFAQANRFLTVEAIFNLGVFFPFENLSKHHTQIIVYPTKIDPCAY